jgi:hypothetical protein
VVAAGRDLTLVVEQPIEHMRGFAGGHRDHRGVNGAYRSERCV